MSLTLSFSLFIFDSVALSRICSHVCLVAHRCRSRSHLLAPSCVCLFFVLSPSLSLSSVALFSTLLAIARVLALEFFLSLSVSLSLHYPFSLSRSQAFPLCLSLSPSLPFRTLFLSYSLSLPFSLSLCLSLSLFLSFCLACFPSLFLLYLRGSLLPSRSRMRCTFQDLRRSPWALIAKTVQWGTEIFRHWLIVFDFANCPVCFSILIY